MEGKNYYANIERSDAVRYKIEIVREELGIPYKLLVKKASFKKSVLSEFVNKRRNLNDYSLDRLEPVVDAYLKIFEDSEKLLRGVNNEE